MPLAFPFEISNRRGVRKYTLQIKVCQCYQPHYSARLSLKQTFRESSFGENIVVEMAAWSEHRGVVPYQIEFLHADFLILIVTRTNEIVPASDGRSDEVDLDLFLLFGIGTPPLPDLTQFDGALGWCFVVRLHPGCMVLWAVDRFWQHCDGPVDQHRDVSPGLRRTLQEEQKEGLTRKQSLRKHWIASFSGAAIAVMLLVILAAAGVRGFQIHQLKRQVIDIARAAGYEDVQVTADWHWESDWYDFTIEAETPDGKNTNSGIARLSDIKSIPYSERFSVYYTFILNRWEVKV